MDFDADNRKWDVLLNSSAQVAAAQGEMGKLNDYRDLSRREWDGMSAVEAACKREQAAVDAAVDWMV